MTRSGSAGSERPQSGDLSGLAELDTVRSAMLLEPSGRVRERTDEGDREGLRRTAVLTTALHSAAEHLGGATGIGDVSSIVIRGAAHSVLLVPVPTRGISLLLLLVCDGDEGGAELHEGVATFLERMSRSNPTGDRGPAGELEASLLEGLDRLFPTDDDLAE